jgi:hypothetical protein
MGWRTRRVGPSRCGRRRVGLDGTFAGREFRDTTRLPRNPMVGSISHGKGGEIDARGWVIELSEPHATAQSAGVRRLIRGSRRGCGLNWWAQRLDGAKCYLEWTTKDAPEFSEAASRVLSRRAWRRANADDESRCHRLPGWSGAITGCGSASRIRPARRSPIIILPHRLRHPAHRQQPQLHPRRASLLPVVERRRVSCAEQNAARPSGHAVHAA